MSMPNTGGNGGGWRDQKGFLHLPGGYEQSVAQRQGQGGNPALQQAAAPQQTTLGGGAETPQFRGPILADSAPLISQQFTAQPWEVAQQRAAQLTQQSQQQAAPPQQPPQGVPQAAAGMPQAQADVLGQRVQGSNIPPELQGRTVGEIIGIANGLRQVHLQSQMQPQMQVPVQPAQPPAQANQPQPFDWRKPDESIGRVVDERLNNVIQQRLAPMLAPLAFQGQVQAAQSARNQAAAAIPGFADIEPQVVAQLRGLDVNALTNPETWKIAAKMVIGEQAMQNQYQTRGAVQQLQPGQQVQNPNPSLNSFFSEQPMQGGPGPQAGVRLSQEQMNAASAMNMSYADYAAWAGGVPGGVR